MSATLEILPLVLTIAAFIFRLHLSSRSGLPTELRGAVSTVANLFKGEVAEKTENKIAVRLQSLGSSESTGQGTKGNIKSAVLDYPFLARM